jgi:hypothetical protein
MIVRHRRITDIQNAPGIPRHKIKKKKKKKSTRFLSTRNDALRNGENTSDQESSTGVCLAFSTMLIVKEKRGTKSVRGGSKVKRNEKRGERTEGE